MKNEILTLARIALISALTLSMVSSASARGGAYQTGFVRWRAADGGCSSWTLSGLT